MRKALIVGIDYYCYVSHLHGCVNDAHSVKSVLERHSDGSVNFSVKLLSGTGPSETVVRSELKEAVRDLFAGDSETALFYFAGHGFIEVTGGYLITSECKSGDDGLSLNDVLILANGSAAKNKIIILDSCHSGVAGTSANNKTHSAELAEGITILTASTADQYATEINGSGVFTSLLVDALSGAAANLVGEVTPGSVYAHIDQSLGPWEQRPVFKTNVKSFVSLRRVQPPIALSDLRRLSELFPSPGFEFPIDPTYEPELKGRDPGMPLPDPEHTRIFAVLQKYNRLNLLVPVDVPHMWNAAMESKACRLTALGEHYRRLVEKNCI
jgi:Caspase domain